MHVSLSLAFAENILPCERKKHTRFMQLLSNIVVIAAAAAAILRSIFNKNESKASTAEMVEQKVRKFQDLMELVSIWRTTVSFQAYCCRRKLASSLFISLFVM